MRTSSSNPYASSRQWRDVPPQAVSKCRWQVIPATLSYALGILLFLMNCIHLHDAMIPEIQRSLDPSTGFTVAHGFCCMIASLLFFGAAGCAIMAARFWVGARYRKALFTDLLGVPGLILLGIFLSRFQIWCAWDTRRKR